jgi:hypothetical protein
LFSSSTSAVEIFQEKKKLQKLIFIAYVAILESLNRTISNWTSLSVICFGVCELSIRCGTAQLREVQQPDKD